MVDILGKARDLESTIARQLDSAARKLARSGAREPLEIVHAVVDAVDREIQPGGRGRRIFPFNRVRVSLLTPTREARDRFEAILSGDSGLRRRIADRLQSAGCSAPDVTVDVTYVARPQKNWRDPEFDVRFARIEEPPPLVIDTQPASPARLDVTVVRGVAEKRTYSFVSDRVDLGRGGEVKDTRGRLIRSNDIAFVEGGGDVNQSVSRQHAHIVCRPGEFRLYDDGSAQGTLIVRQGTTITVFRGSRGVRLNSGDEIVLGEARIKVRISADRSG